MKSQRFILILSAFCALAGKAQIDVKAKVSHEGPAQPGAGGFIHPSISGGSAPYTVYWDGDLSDTPYHLEPAGRQSHHLSVSDRNGANIQRDYRIGYKAIWEIYNNLFSRNDSLLIDLNLGGSGL